SATHIARAKALFHAMIRADLGKNWIGQVTINVADDEELLALAARAGCRGLFIGFESPDAAGLAEIGKKFNLLKGGDFKAAVRRIHRHNILVVGSFIMGLDTDTPGIGQRIAETADHYGVDILNTLFLTPLPGTRLWDQMHSQSRIAADDFPNDWRYYTLGFPTAHYKNFTRSTLVEEMKCCDRAFYSPWRIFRRVADSVLRWRRPLLSLVSNLSYRRNARTTEKSNADLELLHSDARRDGPARGTYAPVYPKNAVRAAMGGDAR
ncbi:MAG: B12-binding domain-containing radical SAM protein, partial [Planctomycetota bacterium]